MKWIISNVEQTKGIIIEAESLDEARRGAHSKFYYAYSSYFEKDLVCGQVLHKGKNGHLDTRVFKKVQFEFHGEDGTGVTTTYDTTIHAELCESQKKFIGNSKVEFIRFFNTDTPEGNYGKKIGNK